MNDLLVGLLSALVATNAPVAVSNLVQQKTGLSIEITDPNDPVEQAYEKVLAADDEALMEITRWRDEAAQSGIKPSEVEASLLNNRIRQRVVPVRAAYEEFLQQHPKHTNARVAYAAFLDEIGDEHSAELQLEKAVQFNTNSPAALNNLANHYGHNGKVSHAFPLYERAIQLAPTEALYCENLATTVYLFRQDAMAYYKITEQEVFTKSLGLYRRAVELDPTNFDRAVEWAKTYYGVKVPPTDTPEAKRKAEIQLADEALGAWEVAYKIAPEEPERQGVRLNFARWQINVGRYEEARRNLSTITNSNFQASKAALLKKLDSRENPPANPEPDPKESPSPKPEE